MGTQNRLIHLSNIQFSIYKSVHLFNQPQLFYRGNNQQINSSMDQTQTIQKSDKKKDQQVDDKKEKKTDKLKHSKKGKRKGSQNSDDEDFKLYIQDKPKKRKKSSAENQITEGQEGQKKRGRKPKPLPENKQNGQKEVNSRQLQSSEAPVVKKRGRPKGSTNKNKQKKEEPKIPKQFECLKKIQPKEKEASSLEDESESGRCQLKTNKHGQAEEKKDVIKVSNMPSQKYTISNVITQKSDPQKNQESQEKRVESEKKQQSESQENQQKQSEKHSQQESQSQQSQSQISSEKPNKQKQQQKGDIKKSPQSQKPPNQKGSQGQQKQQQSLTLPRGKKLNIKSSSQQSQQLAKNQSSKNVREEAQKGRTVNQIKNQALVNITDKFSISKGQAIPEQEELAKLMKRRGRKSHQTQLQIQRLREVVNKKKADFAKFTTQIKPEKVKSQKAQQQNKQDQGESQEQQISQELSDDHNSIKNYKQKADVVPQKPSKSNNNQKLIREQNKIPKENLTKQKINQSTGQKLSIVSKTQIEKEIMTEKIGKLAMQSNICSQQIKCSTPVDSAQQQLFRGWTKYYKRYTQAVSMQLQEEQFKMQSNRKRPNEKKFKRYRKVIIEEEDSDQNSFEQEPKVIKKVRKEKRHLDPVKVIVHKKSKSKRKHKSHSSSESDD